MACFEASINYIDVAIFLRIKSFKVDFQTNELLNCSIRLSLISQLGYECSKSFVVIEVLLELIIVTAFEMG